METGRMPVLRFEVHKIPRLHALRNRHLGICAREEFGAGFQEPLVNRGVLRTQVQSADDGVFHAEGANLFGRILQ
jgi:hypothetical protein